MSKDNAANKPATPAANPSAPLTPARAVEVKPPLGKAAPLPPSQPAKAPLPVTPAQTPAKASPAQAGPRPSDALRKAAEGNQEPVSVAVETITPEQARNMLAKNTNNFRKLSEARARSLAEVMRRGHFKFTGEKIHIRADGTVADGQTRLRACVMAGVPFKTVVVRGDVEDESNIDTGAKRTAGQLLAFHGVASANSVAAAIKAYIALFERQSVSHLAYSAPIAPSEIIAFHKAHPEIDHSVRAAATAPTGMYRSLLAAVHYAGLGIDAEHTQWWIQAVTLGENLAEGDPVLRLRNRFLSGGKRAMIDRREQAALLIKSWNLSREGRSVRALQWRGAGPNPEAFPKLGTPEEAESEVEAAGAGK